MKFEAEAWRSMKQYVGIAISVRKCDTLIIAETKCQCLFGEEWHRILSGGALFSSKKLTTFLVVALKRRLNLLNKPPIISPAQQKMS